MKNRINPTDNSPTGQTTAIKAVIIYEDFDTAIRAKNFAEELERALGCACQWGDSLWRSNLLESPLIADEAALDAADCDYLIVSLRGDHALPYSTQQWIEAQLDRAAARDAGLIVLSDSNRGKWRVVGSHAPLFPQRVLGERSGVVFPRCESTC